MTYANVDNVASELGRTSVTDSGEVAQIGVWLVRVEATIKKRIPDLDARVTSGDLTSDLVANVESAIVARKVLNPEGKQNERVDDYSYGRVPEAASVDLEPTDAEWALLLPDTRAFGAFSTRPTFEADTTTADTW